MMRVVLADLFHLGGAQNPDTAPYTVPLGIGYVAATAKRRGVDWPRSLGLTSVLQG